MSKKKDRLLDSVMGKYIKKNSPPEVPIIYVWTNFSKSKQGKNDPINRESPLFRMQEAHFRPKTLSEKCAQALMHKEIQRTFDRIPRSISQPLVEFHHFNHNNQVSQTPSTRNVNQISRSISQPLVELHHFYHSQLPLHTQQRPVTQLPRSISQPLVELHHHHLLNPNDHQTGHLYQNNQQQHNQLNYHRILQDQNHLQQQQHQFIHPRQLRPPPEHDNNVMPSNVWVPGNPYLNEPIPDWLFVYSRAPFELDHLLKFELFSVEELQRYEALLNLLYRNELEEIVLSFEAYRNRLQEEINRR